MEQFAISAIGRDRPGIVAAISGALLEVGGNLEDSRMANLGGHFAMMLTVHISASDAESLEAKLEAVRADLGLDAVSLSPIGEVGTESGGATHVLTVYGADHPGIVHSICTVLADQGANVTDLKTQLAGSEDNPLYVMIVELALGRTSEVELGQVLTTAGAQAAVEVSLLPLEVESL